ncbi:MULTISPECIES: hypothetical protein [Nitrosomonas]|uniref:Uncharacterized protein n=1 Tax=Nitrosomonas communis TaxID=44574 RepID=A0A0F7KCI7_9PROT|nr:MULTISPECIES: hypothetical protein [Nitrosomonas]AKH36863.1 hypothetical protein AAW31_02080 [Nitrosomonas communis]TYP82763.1 hypothetical protein BCL69_104532 [Nitrosomonas communis]UVS61966.1 hypothetical protein NX761_02195 [Nitrosomonas sp. PLL12]SDX05657.1 hypothetical protein SAMN05421882_105323 [Nitrosomonas communis]
MFKSNNIYNVVEKNGLVMCDNIVTGDPTEKKEKVLELFNTTEGWTARYSGITGSGEYVEREEAHNIHGQDIEDVKRNALKLWGSELKLEDVKVVVHK